VNPNGAAGARIEKGPAEHEQERDGQAKFLGEDADAEGDEREHERATTALGGERFRGDEEGEGGGGAEEIGAARDPGDRLGVGGVDGEDEPGEERGVALTAGVAPREADDEGGGGEVEEEVGQTMTGRPAAPDAGIDHEGEGGEGAEFLERLAPDAVGPFVGEETWPAGEREVEEAGDVDEVIAEKSIVIAGRNATVATASTSGSSQRGVGGWPSGADGAGGHRRNNGLRLRRGGRARGLAMWRRGRVLDRTRSKEIAGIANLARRPIRPHHVGSPNRKFLECLRFFRQIPRTPDCNAPCGGWADVG